VHGGLGRAGGGLRGLGVADRQPDPGRQHPRVALLRDYSRRLPGCLLRPAGEGHGDVRGGDRLRGDRLRGMADDQRRVPLVQRDRQRRRRCPRVRIRRHSTKEAPMRTKTTMLTLALAAGIAAAASAAPAAKPGAVQGDVLSIMADAEKKLLQLEEAVPQNKFDWRPMPGVRSVAEAYLHVAFGNYNMIRIATGKAPPADAGFALDRGKWDTQTTDKAKIKAILQKSFAFAHDALQTLPDADLDKKVEFFG